MKLRERLDFSEKIAGSDSSVKIEFGCGEEEYSRYYLDKEFKIRY